MADKITEARKQFGQFDLGRLTWVGWLLFLASIAVPGVAMFYLLPAVEEAIGSNGSRGMRKLAVAPFVLAMIGMFLLCQFLFGRAGVVAVRPMAPPGDGSA